jgi:hypothetical protein
MENIMQAPSMLQGNSRKRLLQGALGRRYRDDQIGFNWGGSQ